MEDSFGKEGNRINMLKYLDFAPAELIDSTIWHETQNSTVELLGEPDEKCDFGFETSYIYFLQGFAGLSYDDIDKLRPFCNKSAGFGNTKLVIKFEPNGDYKSYAVIHAGG